jgi:hypothetical protein
MAIVDWGDVHVAGKKGRPLLHMHDLCGKDFDPVMVCSECGEPLLAKQVRVHLGPGGKSRSIYRWKSIPGPPPCRERDGGRPRGYAVCGRLAATLPR